MEVCRKLGNIKLENRPYTEVSGKLKSGAALVTRDVCDMGWLMYPPLDLARFEDCGITTYAPDSDLSAFMQCSALRIEARSDQGL
jgi:hypothetical protein